MGNIYQQLLTSKVRSATNSSVIQKNYRSRGLHLVIDMTVVPGVDTVTPKIEGYDALSGKYYDLLVGTALVATGTVVLKIYPGIAASANASASDILPDAWRVTMTHSAATNFTYSVAASLIR